MDQFFAMGGYAAFVWPAYALTIAALALAIVITVSAYARARRTVDHLEGTRP